MNTYREWLIHDALPVGWVIDKTAGSPAPRTVFITNGKSVLSGQQQRALLRVKPEPSIIDHREIKFNPKPLDVRLVDFPAESVNALARKKFQERLLIDIRVDLMVCEIEGWDKKEYINELKKLINGINLLGKRKSDNNQPTLFDINALL